VKNEEKGAERVCKVKQECGKSKVKALIRKFSPQRVLLCETFTGFYLLFLLVVVAPQRFLLLSATFTGCCLFFYYKLGNDHIADGFDEGEEEEQANEVEDVEEVSGFFSR